MVLIRVGLSLWGTELYSLSMFSMLLKLSALKACQYYFIISMSQVRRKTTSAIGRHTSDLCGVLIKSPHRFLQTKHRATFHPIRTSTKDIDFILFFRNKIFEGYKHFLHIFLIYSNSRTKVNFFSGKKNLQTL